MTGCGSWPCTNGERRYQEFDYDTWGNKVETRNWGNYDVSGDETTSTAEFYPNASAYVTNKTARKASYVGIGTAGTKLAESQFLYDGASQYTSSPTDGLLTKTLVWRNTDNQMVPSCNLASCVQYDAYGNVTQTTDIKGGQTAVVYDPTYHKFPTSVTNALSQTTTSDWNELCEGVSSTTNPNNQTTSTTYDVFCRHERTDGPLGSFAESFYQNFGNPGTQYVEVQGPSPDGTGVAWARSYFDGLGRTYERESRGPSGGQDIFSGEVTFNERGGVLSSTATRYANDPAEVTSFQYDALDRKILTTLPDLNTVSQSYGLRESYVTDPEGHTTGTARDETGLVRYTIEYLGGTPIITSITTDLTNRTQTTQDHQGNVWVSQRDSLGEVISLSDPDSGTETREYDDSGEMTATVNALSERTELTYDLLGRLTQKKTRTGSPDEDVTTFAYDEARSGYFNVGHQTTMTDSAGTTKSDFDELGRPARSERTIDGIPYTSTTSYNTAGLPASMTYPDNQTIDWTYDAAGNLQTETGTITGSTYDAAGRMLSRSFTNGVVTTQSYSAPRGWLENIHTVKDTTVHQDLTYQYYPDGTVESVTSAKPMESWTYAYDDLNRLLSATNVDTPSLTESFTYDDIGNMLSNSDIGTYTYPAPGNALPHAVQTAGSRSYAYNAIGQMTSRNGTLIQWNGDGKPSSIGSVAFVYDGVGNRLKKISGSETTKYIGGDYEIAPDGTVTKYLVGGKQVGTDFFILLRDHLGSIQSVTDSSGVEVRRQDHKPFGDQHYVWGTHQESKGWIGEREEETELVYLNARYYDPEIGRFTAPDPIVRPGQGLNRFAYALNDPIAYLDPSGLDCNSSSGTIFGGVQVTPGYSYCDINDFFLEGLGGFFHIGLAGKDEKPSREERRQRRQDRAKSDTSTSNSTSTDNTGDGSGTTSTTTGQGGQQPDNPLYNCQNGLKTNCPGNRAPGSEGSGGEFGGAGGSSSWQGDDSTSGFRGHGASGTWEYPSWDDAHEAGWTWDEWFSGATDEQRYIGETLDPNPVVDPTYLLIGAAQGTLEYQSFPFGSKTNWVQTNVFRWGTDSELHFHLWPIMKLKLPGNLRTWYHTALRVLR